jgi:hydroxyethylthiazole kinase-like uncharacterized protein yjeF
MKILSSEQTRKADNYSIANEPITSLDLMERAASCFVTKFTSLYPDCNHPIRIFCGTGNNGGDGLAITRLLHEANYHVRSFSIGSLTKATDDFNENFARLPNRLNHAHIEAESSFPLLSDHEIIIDGLFGSGLNRPVEGLAANLIHHINESGAKIVSIDIASGLFADQRTSGDNIIKPTDTISFQLPKLAFFLPENEAFVGQWHVIPIGLSPKFIDDAECKIFLLEASDIKVALPQRSKFAHKGDAGRLLIIAGSKGKMGAAILATRAALRMGAGLLYAHVPAIGRDAMQISVPEAMVLEEWNLDCISDIQVPEKIASISIGPGIGTQKETAEAIYQLLKNNQRPMVLDADVLNILAMNPEWMELLPHGSILTPHPGEFERLAGKWMDEFHRLDMMRDFCAKYHVHMVVKGAHSAICHPNGDIYFNSTGNPGMATGGSGDVLTGIIGSLLAQGVESADAIQLGVYLHGLAGDVAEKNIGELSMSASDIIQFLPKAIQQLNSI